MDVITEGHFFPKKAFALCPFFCYQVVKFPKTKSLILTPERNHNFFLVSLISSLEDID
jgi:hypothetical protein